MPDGSPLFYEVDGEETLWIRSAGNDLTPQTDDDIIARCTFRRVPAGPLKKAQPPTENLRYQGETTRRFIPPLEELRAPLSQVGENLAENGETAGIRATRPGTLAV